MRKEVEKFAWAWLGREAKPCAVPKRSIRSIMLVLMLDWDHLGREQQHRQ